MRRDRRPRPRKPRDGEQPQRPARRLFTLCRRALHDSNIAGPKRGRVELHRYTEVMSDDLHERWRERHEQAKQRDDVDFDTLSSVELDPLYGPDAVDELIGVPGEYPFTRGIYPSMYRGRLWTMRQFAGFGSPEQTNTRYK